jgi:hypothetical protein
MDGGSFRGIVVEYRKYTRRYRVLNPKDNRTSVSSNVLFCDEQPGWAEKQESEEVTFSVGT